MKSFKEVEEARRSYHTDGTRNSVHCSSLTIPELPGCQAEATFVNHFLLKRNYEKVACRVTAIDPDGNRLESRMHKIDAPKVYTVPLSGMTDSEAATYLIEFFTADNLFIPFPAVMVNHVGDNFINSVHAYNRVLNDVFENDSVNANSVREASICMARKDGAETIAVVAAGQQPLRGSIDVEVALPGQLYQTSVPVDLARFGHKTLAVDSCFPDLPKGMPGVLKIRQPPQFMFYGRLLTGQRLGDSFSCNHSYYDSSETPEYWDTPLTSERQYPFFSAIQNNVRMYPIMSPGTLDVSIELIGDNGRSLRQSVAGHLTSPGNQFLDLDINAFAIAAGIDLGDLVSFIIKADGDRVPTRVNHQLVHTQGALESSINVSLYSPNVFQPEGKTGLCWGQIPLDPDLNSWVGIVGGMGSTEDAEVDVIFYDSIGELARRTWPLKGTGAIRFNASEELAHELSSRPAGASRYVWYIIRSRRPNLSAFVVAHQLQTNNCSGEHSF